VVGRVHRLAAGVLLSLLFAAGPGVARSTPDAACRLSQFKVVLGPGISEATGQHTLALRLVGSGRASCILDGYPRVALYDRAGLIPFSIRNGGGQMITHHRPTRFGLDPGGSAWVVLNNYRCDLGSKRAATRVRIWLAAPALDTFAAVRIVDPYRRLHYCGKGDPGSILTVSPFEPTLRAALGG
jgi:hypothetical protein